MIDVILYNPISSKGRNVKLAAKLEKKLIKQGKEVQTISLFNIVNVKDFLSGFSSDDRIILLGGDGTLHRIVNQIQGLEIKPQVYLYKAGTGNDFIRSVKVNHHLAEVKSHIAVLPTMTIGSKQFKVINGGGVGLDGLVAYKVNRSKEEKNKSNYFKNALKSFMEFKPVKATFTANGKTWTENKVWFASAMYSQYFGGGMKIAPFKHRSDPDIELVIVKDVPKWVLILIFPTIYFGWHRIFKQWVQFYRTQSVKVEFETPQYLQADGEHEYPVLGYEMKMD